MDGEDTEQLFLLEVLVDNVHISRSCVFVDKSGGPINTQLTTVFQFLKFPPLEIKERSYQQKGDEPPSFRTGKSCLFAIPSKKLVDFSKLFNVNVSVLRRFPAGVLPEKRIVGEATVDISSDFAYVVTEVLTNPQIIPKSQSVRESYRLRGPSAGSGGGANYVGSISLFLRISCFGKLIVNEFQLSGESSVALVDGATSSGVPATTKPGGGGGGEAWRRPDVTEITPLSRPTASVSARPNIICVGAGEYAAEEKELADADKKSVGPTRPPQLRGAPLAPVTAAAANVVRCDPLTRGLVLNLLQPDVASGETSTPRVAPSRTGRRRRRQRRQLLQGQEANRARSLSGTTTNGRMGVAGGGSASASGICACGVPLAPTASCYSSGVSSCCVCGASGTGLGPAASGAPSTQTLGAASNSGGGNSGRGSGGSLPASRESRHRAGSECRSLGRAPRPSTQPVGASLAHLGDAGERQLLGGQLLVHAGARVGKAGVASRGVTGGSSHGHARAKSKQSAPQNKEKRRKTRLRA